MIDVHNHLQDHRFEGRQDDIIRTMKDIGITQCVVNGTSENDWTLVADLSTRHPDFIIPSFGLHPWKVAYASSDWLAILEKFLISFPHSTLGECGLDLWIKEPHFPRQLDAFSMQIDLAHHLNRPVTIHALKAWQPLIQLLQSKKQNLPKLLFHSFNGSIEIAQQLLKLPTDVYFSFSGHFLHNRKEKVRKTFAQLPQDRILAETDAPDMLPPSPQFTFKEQNHPANLAQTIAYLKTTLNLEPKVFTQNTLSFLEESSK